MSESSGLSFIAVTDPSNPASLFHQWIKEAEEGGVKSFLMNLATSTKNGRVNNRTVVVREVMPDASLAYTAQAKSSKIKEINENSQVAATVLLQYNNDGEKVSRQVRFMGTAEKLSKDQSKIYFEKESLHAKIRTVICQDCAPVEWEELKRKHDELLKEVTENKKVLEMPDSEVAYKVVPCQMDFYSAIGDRIADRIIFEKGEGGKWNCQRMMT